MLSYVRYKLALWKIARREKDLEKRCPPDTPEAYESGQMASFIEEFNDLHAWRRIAQTEYFRRKADRLLVQMPSFEEEGIYEQVEWDKDIRQPIYLTDKGFKFVRDAIREEQKHRRESVNYWFAIAVGVIGSIAGLISAFKQSIPAEAVDVFGQVVEIEIRLPSALVC